MKYLMLAQARFHIRWTSTPSHCCLFCFKMARGAIPFSVDKCDEHAKTVKQLARKQRQLALLIDEVTILKGKVTRQAAAMKLKRPSRYEVAAAQRRVDKHRASVAVKKNAIADRRVAAIAGASQPLSK